MRTEHHHTLIIGVGNEYRRDDGVGLVLARRLRSLMLAGVSVVELSGEGAALLEVWKGHTTVFLVDAVDSGAPPGTIHRLDARAGPDSNGFFHDSTHAFSAVEAIELARALNQLPPLLILYLVEGKDFGLGAGLSLEVERRVPEVIAQVTDELGSLMGDFLQVSASQPP